MIQKLKELMHLLHVTFDDFEHLTESGFLISVILLLFFFQSHSKHSLYLFFLSYLLYSHTLPCQVCLFLNLFVTNQQYLYCFVNHGEVFYRRISIIVTENNSEAYRYQFFMKLPSIIWLINSFHEQLYLYLIVIICMFVFLRPVSSCLYLLSPSLALFSPQMMQHQVILYAAFCQIFLEMVLMNKFPWTLHRYLCISVIKCY